MDCKEQYNNGKWISNEIKKVLSYSMGGFLTLFLHTLYVSKLSPLHDEATMIFSGKISNDVWISIVSIVIFVGSLCLFVYALWLYSKKVKLKKIVVALTANIFCIINVLGCQKIYVPLLLCLLYASVIICQVIIDFIPEMYKWLKKTDSESFNVAKLTFLWTILAFILTAMGISSK